MGPCRSGSVRLVSRAFIRQARSQRKWDQLPPDRQKTCIENAPTFLDEARDPEQLAFDLDAMRKFRKPVLLTIGDKSPPTFPLVISKLAAVLPDAEVVTIRGAGHIPHTTHPDVFVDAIEAFTSKSAA